MFLFTLKLLSTKARILRNTFDAALSFSCDGAQVYAGDNVATSIDFGDATVVNAVSGSSETVTTPTTTIDLTEINQAIEVLRKELDDKATRIEEVVTANEKYKQITANILAQIGELME